MQASWAFEPWRDVGGATRAPSDEGETWLAVRSIDPAGPVSPVAWHRVRVDATGPRLRIRTESPGAPAGIPPAWHAPGQHSLVCTAEDPAGIGRLGWGDARDAAVEGETRIAAPIGSLPELERLDGRGRSRVVCEGTDSVGNKTRATRVLYLDATPPTVQWRGGGGELTDTRPAHRPVGYDAQSGLVSWTTSRTADVVEARAVDGAGLRTDDSRRDPAGEPPTLQIELPAPTTERFYDGPTRIRVTSARPARLEWSDDGALWTSVEGNTVSTTSDWIVVRATDPSGRVAERSLALPRDEDAPEGRLFVGDRAYAAHQEVRVIVGETVHVEVMDAGSGVAQANVSWRRRGRSREASTTLSARSEAGRAATLAFSSPGERRVRVQATDALGNTMRDVWRVRVEAP